jgi:hypothetical protein
MSILALLTSLTVSIPTPAGPPNPEPVHGRIEIIDDIRIVHVFGTHEQMGFAHGWLAGEDFVVGMQELFAGLPPAAVSMARLMRSWTPMIQLSEDQRDELHGLYRGMVARLGEKAMALPGAGRNVDETDLLIWNGYDMFRAVGCSGFTAWGERTNEGEVITARTLDLGIFSPRWASNQILLVRHPSKGKATACVTPVGLLGIMTGINEEGVCGFLHDGNGPEMDAVLEPERPIMFAIRDILEQASAGDALAVAAAELATQGPFPYSYLVRIITPDDSDTATPPACVYQIDAEGMGRNASDLGMAITTNHYTDATTLAPVAFRGDSNRRYARIHRTCQPRETADSALVTDATAWSALRRVAADHLLFKTLHAVVAKPKSGEFQVSVAVMNPNGRIEPATERKPATFTRAQLFDAPPPMLTLHPAPGPNPAPGPDPAPAPGPSPAHAPTSLPTQ